MQANLADLPGRSQKAMMTVVKIRPTARVAAHCGAFYQHPGESQARRDRSTSRR